MDSALALVTDAAVSASGSAASGSGSSSKACGKCADGPTPDPTLTCDKYRAAVRKYCGCAANVSSLKCSDAQGESERSFACSCSSGVPPIVGGIIAVVVFGLLVWGLMKL